MVNILIAVALCALFGIPFVMWYDRAKKEMEEEDMNEDEDENEEDYQ